MNFNATPRKRPAPGEPGSTPFSSSKFQSSLVPMGRPTPSRSYHPPKPKTSKPTGFSSNTRDIFRTSTPQANRVSTFSPDLPPAATKATPSARKFVPQKSIGAGMSSAASADLFKMRIPSPDPELTGEILAKQVPDDPNRTGTIYTDQYLAHKCPPHFDELQRRQFFCILDLRRLKYAANEIFAKKDWKLNILNFAKEYEKSRGLILLRYGLYEFKKVKPSAEVLKRWRAAHGLPAPESEDKEIESSSANLNRRSVGTATKRKADAELEPKDNALTASTANQNKRRNMDQEMGSPILSGPAPFKKSKRKVEEADEPDENQPSKQQKQETSTAKSTFESILDNAQSTPSPLKRAPLGAAAQSTPFGTPKISAFQSTDSAVRPNPFATPSVSQPSTSLFGSKPTNGNGPQKHESVLAAHKPGSTLPPNTGMFGYLSGSSANTSGNEKEDADDEDAESESGSEPGAESQDAAPSYEPSAAASTGTSTPPAQNGTSIFSSSKPGGTSAPLGGLFNQPADTAAKGGLFDRVKLGADGQPMRATRVLDEEKTPVPEVSTPSTPAVETSKTPAKTPGDFRFDPTTTPISFSQPSTTPATAKPSLFSAAPVSDTPKGLPKTEDVPATKPSSIFASTTQASSTSGTAAPKPLFGQTNNTSSIFQPKPSGSTSSIFGVQKPVEEKPTDATKQPSASPTKSSFDDIFRKKPEPTTSAPPEQPKSLFSTAFADTPSAVTPSTNNTGLFVKPAESGVKGQPQNLFNTPSASATPKVVFEKQTESKPPGVQEPPKGLFGASVTPITTPSGVQDAPRPTGLFGASVTPGNTPLFQSNKRGFGDETGEPSAKKPASTSVFGANGTAGSFGGWGSTNTQSPTPQSPVIQAPAKSIFNNFKPETPNGTSDPAQGAKSIFSTTPANSFPAPTTPKPTFTPSFSFGANQPAPTEQTQNGSMHAPNMFGNSTATSGPSFEFKAPSPAPSSPAPVPGGRRIATPKRRLGGSQTPNTSFNSGLTTSQPQPNTGFSFGSNAPGPGSVTSSFEKENSNGGFNFTFGGNGQSVSNPFNPSNGQASTPMFGNNASAPSASTSFSATPNTAPPTQSMVFGGTANGMNGAPSINLQASTPQQNTPNIFAPKNASLFGNTLQPSGDGTTGANSPMAASSSMGTTPVNGTPEPQTQNQDGEEAPQEQISLTAGGPGEEDEEILHEVRAKAIKYIPVSKDDEGEKAKSPWQTQGIGPLRILKNKSTGSVRLLLRAEPRGHIAMNKAILPDVDYNAKDKTINFAAASDDGAGLETWVLQVKKPEFAQELASVMEANKTANKK